MQQAVPARNPNFRTYSHCGAEQHRSRSQRRGRWAKSKRLCLNQYARSSGGEVSRSRSRSRSATLVIGILDGGDSLSWRTLGS